MGRLNDRVALITGGGAGIGEACVRRFATEGACVLIADMEAERGQALAAEIGDLALFHSTDVADESQFSAAVETAVAAWGKLDIVVNNAGVVVPAAPVQDTTSQEFNLLIEVNIRGVFHGCKIAYPYLKQSKGCVVNIASMAGVSGQANHAIYGATKGAVNALTRCTAVDWGREGIRINAICPACVLTERTQDWINAQPDAAEAAAALSKIHSLQRAAEPSEIAAAAVYLCSDDASFVTGCIMPVSGGSECGYKMDD